MRHLHIAHEALYAAAIAN